MSKSDFIRAAAVSPALKVANTSYNTEQIIDCARRAADSGAAGDFNLATFLPVELSPERAEIPCDFPRAGSVIVLSDGKEASVLACGADGRWVPVGNLAKGRKVNTFSLKSVKKPVKALGLTGKKGSSVNIFEVIWK